ncbi:response regulator, partial [Candidatus Poribacteria bacterium]|nr:response regulator [Candidatus Poribacteria bacterium]
DLTLRRKAEDENRRLAAFPRENPDPILECAEDGSVTYANPAAQRILRELGLAAPEGLLARDHALMARGCLRTGAMASSVQSVVGGRCFEWSYHPLADLRVVHVCGDEVTEQRQNEEALAHLDEELRQARKLETLGRLVGGVAHDFNNLLTIISGCSHLLSQRLPEGDPLFEITESIRRATRRAAALTRQLLSFGRRQPLRPRPVNLAAALEDIERMLRRLIGEGIELVIDADSHEGIVKMDPGQFDQIILNLAANARDAMPEGGRLAIETSNQKVEADSAMARSGLSPGEYIVVSVSDTGIGMDADIQSKIFEPFFTTKGPDRGTGLGLSTVLEIARAAGGNVTVSSQKHHGTTFRVYLPQSDELPVLLEPGQATPLPLPGSETILLAEDDPEVRETAFRIRREQGYKVIEAANGVEALEVCRNHRGIIHLLLADVVMPAVGGVRLATEATEARPYIKVLLMSGYTDEAAQQGADPSLPPILEKPFTPRGLANRVREVLDSDTIPATPAPR